MSKRRLPRDEDEEEESGEAAPPAKVARKMSVDELVQLLTSEEDTSLPSYIITEAFTNVIETWNVRDWLAFTKATASWSGLRHPHVTAHYIGVWKGLVMRDFHCIVREQAGTGLYKFLRNINWLWERKRNNPAKPYPRPGLRDFWRRAYFAANKYLHYLLGWGVRFALDPTRLRPDEPTDVLPDPRIVPADFRPWIETPEEIMQNRNMEDRGGTLDQLGMRSMTLAPNSTDLSALIVDVHENVVEGATASANTTAFTKWVQSRYHSIPVRLATQGVPSPFIVIPVSLFESGIRLTERIESRGNIPELSLAYTLGLGSPDAMIRVVSVEAAAMPNAALEIAPSDVITDLFGTNGEAERILIGRAVPLAEYRVQRFLRVHTIKTSLGLRAVDAESLALAALGLIDVEEVRLADIGLETDTDVLMFILGVLESQESRGVSRMRHVPLEADQVSQDLFIGHRTTQLDGWRLFLQLCLTDDPAQLIARRRSIPGHFYFDSLTRLFRSPPDDQAHLDPFRTMPEPPNRRAIVGPPQFILFDCSICRSAPATHCALDTPLMRYCADCARL